MTEKIFAVVVGTVVTTLSIIRISTKFPDLENNLPSNYVVLENSNSQIPILINYMKFLNSKLN